MGEDLGSLRVPKVADDGTVRSSSACGPPRPFAERRISNTAGADSPGGGIAFAAQPQKGRLRRPLELPAKEKGDFKAYMARMQESGQPFPTPSTQLQAKWFNAQPELASATERLSKSQGTATV